MSQVAKVHDSKTESDDEDGFIVEKIVGMRQVQGIIYYLVKWKNWPNTDNTWEPIEHLEGCPVILADYQKDQAYKLASLEREAKLFRENLDVTKTKPKPKPRKRKASPAKKKTTVKKKKAVSTPSSSRKYPKRERKSTMSPGRNKADESSHFDVLLSAIQSTSDSGVLRRTPSRQSSPQKRALSSSSESFSDMDSPSASPSRSRSSSPSSPSDLEFNSPLSPKQIPSGNNFLQKAKGEAIKTKLLNLNLGFSSVKVAVRNLLRYDSAAFHFKSLAFLSTPSSQSETIANPLFSAELKSIYQLLWAISDVDPLLLEDTISYIEADV